MRSSGVTFQALLVAVLWVNEVISGSDDIGPPVPVKTEHLPAHYFPELDSKRVKVNYGLLDVPPMHEDGGMISTFFRVPLPCEDCLVTWMQAGLEYADGSRADADTGMWLHHTVFSTLNKPNRVCPGEKIGDWFFASGNERSEINLCENGRTRSGYYINSEDTVTAVTDLMNMLHHKQTVALTITWEYIPSPPGSEPANHFTYLTPYWLDIGGCSNSEMSAKPNAHFHYSMPAKIAQIPGEVRMMVGHLHDGGTRLDVLCDGEIVCSMDARYSLYDGDEHLSGISNCSNVGAMSPGQSWSITAHYNTMLHKPMVEHDGNLEPIMGIVLAYVAEEDPDMDSGKGREHQKPRHQHHVLLTVGVIFSVVAVTAFAGSMWLRRRGETVMNYVPDKLQRFGNMNIRGFKNRIVLRGERPSASLLDHGSLPTYRDEE